MQLQLGANGRSQGNLHATAIWSKWQLSRLFACRLLVMATALPCTEAEDFRELSTRFGLTLLKCQYTMYVDSRVTCHAVSLYFHMGCRTCNFTLVSEADPSACRVPCPRGLGRVSELPVLRLLFRIRSVQKTID